LGKHWVFSGGPKLGAFPDCIPTARIHGVVGRRWQYGICECVFPSDFPRSCSSYWIAYIVRVVYFIAATTDGRFGENQSKVLHVRSLNFILHNHAGLHTVPAKQMGQLQVDSETRMARKQETFHF
jgi:hypothetical protein